MRSIILIKSDDEIILALAFFLGATLGVMATLLIKWRTSKPAAKAPAKYRPRYQRP